MAIISDLDVYKKAHALVLKIYKITKKYPKDEIYGLTSQMKRAAISINSNLLEGSARNGTLEFKHFASIARGSAAELKYQVLVSKDLGFITLEEFNCLDAEITDILKMLSGLIK